MSNEAKPIPISVRCLNLKLHSKAVFQNVGLLTNLFARATGAAANAKNEKRYIRIFQSKPFRIGTRPDVDYEPIYTSETFEDVTDVCPSLLAYIPTFKEMDTQLRLSIYYNSSITGGKDVLLGLTNFTVADMLRSCSYNAAGTTTYDIHSEYCAGIKAYIEIIDPLPPLLDEEKMPIFAPRTNKNPLTQNYVFFSDHDNTTPLLKVSEQSWEPKFSAWKLRQEQERIRQGKFISDNEAFGYGWYVVEVTVRGARLGTHDPNIPSAPAGSPQQSNAVSYTIRLPFSPEYISDLDRVAPNAALTPVSPQLERRARTSSASANGSFGGRGANLVRSKSGRLTSTNITGGIKGNLLPAKKFDELLPSTFVQINLEDKCKTFAEPIGRTNTEYYTLFPVYGTNINASYARRGPQQNASTSQEKIQATCYEKEIIYNVFESTNRLFLPRRWQQWAHWQTPPVTARQNSASEDSVRVSDSSTVSTADEQQYTFDSQMATHTTFKLFAANSDRSSLRLDLMTETSSGQIKRMGTVAVPLTDMSSFSGWLPMNLFNIDESASVFECGELLVDVKVHSPSAANAGFHGVTMTPLDTMEDVFHLQRRTDGTVDSITDEIVTDYRYNLAQCYEWMWTLGLVAQDPLMVDGGRTIASHLSQTDLQQLVDKMVSHAEGGTSSPNASASVGSASPTPQNSISSTSTSTSKPRRPSVTFRSPDEPPTSVSSSSLNLHLPTSFATDPFKSEAGTVQEKDPTVSEPTPVKIERSLSADDLKDMVKQTLDPRKPVRRGSKVLPTLKMDEDTDDEDDDEDEDGNEQNTADDANGVDPSERKLRKKLSQQGLLDNNDISVSVASLMLESVSDKYESSTVASNNEGNTANQATAASHSSLLQSMLRMDEEHAGEVIEDNHQMHAYPDDMLHLPVSETDEDEGNVINAQETTASVDRSDGTVPPMRPLPPKRRRSVTNITCKPRIDVTYNYQWIGQHIRDMQELIDEMELFLAGLRLKIRSDRCFRASVYKKDAEWQMLPTNLHYQLLGIQMHRPKRRGCPIEPDTSIPMDVVHSVTCGAMTPHMLKHKKGGLFHQEQECEVKRNESNILKGRYLTQVNEAKSTHKQSLLPMDAKEGPYKTLLLLGNKVQSWESQILEIGRRRMYAMSQSISIAVNAFLLKLNLLCKGALEVSLAEKWLTAGFLIMFEGLLSVTGHEKSMLEDTITAVDVLRNFRLRLLSKKYYEGTNISQQQLTRQGSRYVYVASNARLRSSSNMSARSDEVSAHAEDDDDEDDFLPDPDFTFQGREIRIYLSKKAIEQLPQSFRQLIDHGEGAIVTLCPVLFTQGIDMQQTMANTFGSDMSAFELQYLINNRALQWMNTYCHRVQPLDSTSAHANVGTTGNTSPSPDNHMMAKSGKVNYHPLVTEVHQAMNSSAAQLSLKNVELLDAVERLIVLLDGIRVTFCKSGKDRTGMAVTLDQARQVSTRYGLFTGILQHHTTGHAIYHHSHHAAHAHSSSNNSSQNASAASNNLVMTLLEQKLLDIANLMRVYGTRIAVADKNIGRPVYSINLLQARFLPPLLRPPPAVCEALLKKDNS